VRVPMVWVVGILSHMGCGRALEFEDWCGRLDQGRIENEERRDHETRRNDQFGSCYGVIG